MYRFCDAEKYTDKNIQICSIISYIPILDKCFITFIVNIVFQIFDLHHDYIDSIILYFKYITLQIYYNNYALLHSQSLRVYFCKNIV